MEHEDRSTRRESERGFRRHGEPRPVAEATAAEDLGASARQTGRDLAHDVRERALRTADDGRRRVAEEIRTVSEALRAGASRLRERDDVKLADKADALADRIDSAASYVRDRDLETLLDDGRAFARRHTALFLGGLAAAGFVLARFLTAAAPDEAEPDGPGRSSKATTDLRYRSDGPPGSGSTFEAKSRQEVKRW